MNQANSTLLPENGEAIPMPPVPEPEKIPNKPPVVIPSGTVEIPNGESVHITYDEGYEGDAAHRRYRNANGQFVTKEVVEIVDTMLLEDFSKDNAEHSVSDDKDDSDQELHIEKDVESLDAAFHEAFIRYRDNYASMQPTEITDLEDYLLDLNRTIYSLDSQKHTTITRDLQKNLIMLMTKNGLRLDVTEEEVDILDDVFDVVYEILEEDIQLPHDQRVDLEEYLLSVNRAIYYLDSHIDKTTLEEDEYKLREKLEQFRYGIFDAHNNQPTEQNVEFDNDNLTVDEREVLSYLVRNLGNAEDAAEALSEEEFNAINEHITNIEQLYVNAEQGIIEKMLAEGAPVHEVNESVMAMRQREAKAVLNKIYIARQRLLNEQGDDAQISNLSDQILALSEAISRGVTIDARYYKNGLIVPSGNVAYNYIIEHKTSSAQPTPRQNHAALATRPLPERVQGKPHKRNRSRILIGALGVAAASVLAGALLTSDSSNDRSGDVAVEAPADDDAESTANGAEFSATDLENAVEEATAPLEERVESLSEENDNLEASVTELQEQLDEQKALLDEYESTIDELEAALEVEAPETEPTSPETEPTTPETEPTTPETEPTSPETEASLEGYKNLNVASGAGFQSSIKSKYGLNDADSWRAYKAIEPYLRGAPGTYLGPNDVRISAPGIFEMPDEAAKVLKEFVDSLDTSESDDE